MPRGRPKKIKQPASALQSLYSVKLSVNGKDYAGEGETLSDAIKMLKPETLKTRGILRITKGDRKIERFLIIPQMKRIFGDFNSFTRQVALESTSKYLNTLLN